MPKLSGPRGCPVYVERASDTPLVWLRISSLSGCVSDPIGREGHYRHAFELARRGTEHHTRARLDDKLDALGASMDSVIRRDSAGYSIVCMSDKLGEVSKLAAEVLACPTFAIDEHERRVRETANILDELRDNDAELAVRFFIRDVAPNYAYARATLGTNESLSRFDASEAQATYRDAMAPGNVVFGLAGDIDDESAMAAAAVLANALPDTTAPRRPELVRPAPEPTRIVLVDKPQRTQSQIVLGSIGPAYASDDYTALLPAQTAFGGMFTSRLMQEVRVKRGWSYGASMDIGEARGPQWLYSRIAPGTEQATSALKLVVDMMTALAQKGLTDEELDLATRYLSGQTAFKLATASLRLSAAMNADHYGIEPGYPENLAGRLQAIDADSIHEAIRKWIIPTKLSISIVATASDLEAPLRDLGLGAVKVVPFDSY